MKKILVCEDEDSIREFVVINLRRAGYEVVDVDSGEKALWIFDRQQDFDIALLDIMMPGMDGFTLCKKLRGRSQNLGIILLTAKTQEMDKVNGLMLGADDYVTKPFSPSELVARVDAVYRRVQVSGAGPLEEPPILAGPFTLYPKTRILLKEGQFVDLTQVEYQMMELFLRSPGVALERKRILHHVWGEGYNGEEKIVDVNVRRLRVKLEKDPSNPQHLKTVWGFGYKWTVIPDSGVGN